MATYVISFCSKKDSWKQEKKNWLPFHEKQWANLFLEVYSFQILFFVEQVAKLFHDNDVNRATEL